jgi:hypothetical protein
MRLEVQIETDALDAGAAYRAGVLAGSHYLCTWLRAAPR